MSGERQSPPSIEDYAFIGDTRTGALCSSLGSIDWLCLPRFDSDPVFSRLIAPDRGARFAIEPIDHRATSRRYRDASGILETRWRTATGQLLLTDGMVLTLSGKLLPDALLVRRVACTAGHATVEAFVRPLLGLPGAPPRVARRLGSLVFTWGSLALSLGTTPDVGLEPAKPRRITLQQGESVTFVLALAERSPVVAVSAARASEELEDSERWWRSWSESLRYDGPRRDSVVRSMITLRLLTYSPSGAPVAALTTSLPEIPGGDANWDYRFSWPRDAGIGLAAFLSLGKSEEGHSFMHWLLHASRLTRPRLEVLYTVHGKPGPKERDVDEVDGYRGSLPVRIGNGASEQHQLDVYGWVVDAAWNLAAGGVDLHAETRRAVAGLADFVAAHWRDPDSGIWELRGEPAHYVESKAMAWLALDRALRLATRYGARRTRSDRWRHEKDALLDETCRRGFDTRRNTFLQSFGSDRLDAALLILPALDLPSELRPRLEGTVEAVSLELSAGGPLLYRFHQEGEPEGAFLPCSFWLVQALARLGRGDEASQLFADLLALANDVGLFAEEIDPATHHHLGNFPQAFTHATAVQAALALSEGDDQRGSRKSPSSPP